MKSNKNVKHQESILGMVTVNDKGQVVIPADARSSMNIKPGDKLLVIIHPSHGGVVLVKPDGIESFARQMLQQVSDAKDITLDQGKN
jgi:AbrB family looped-hinge helix DNA binding protein